MTLEKFIEEVRKELWCLKPDIPRPVYIAAYKSAGYLEAKDMATRTIADAADICIDHAFGKMV